MKKKLLKKSFWITLFWKQNKYHKHGVLMHTLKVFYVVLKNKNYKMLMAALLHDIGKPFSAHQKPEDIIVNEYSFTDHEEMSFQLIKYWPVSYYTKMLVRYHYIIRRMSKLENQETREYKRLKKTWDTFDSDLKNDIRTFMGYDDKGKR